MGTTFGYIVSNYRKKDGTYMIRLWMTHNRITLKKPTTIFVKKDDLTRDLNKVRDVSILEAINRQINRLRKTLETIEGSNYYKAEELWNAVIERLKYSSGFRLDFFEYAGEKMKAMEAKTAEGYRTSLNALKRFINDDRLDINDITYKFLCDFKTFLETEPAVEINGKKKAKEKGCRAISYYLSCLRHIHNLAREEFNDEDVNMVMIPRAPFRQGLIPAQPKSEISKVLGKETILEIANLDLQSGSRSDIARDVFILSFMLVGTNTIDLYHLKDENLLDGIISYNRRKTDSVRSDKAIMKVMVEEEVFPYFEKHKGINHLFSFADRYSDARGFNNAINKGLKEVGKMVGVEGLTTYHARHSWATIARNDCKVDFYVVHEALNHAKRGEDKVTDIYVERNWNNIFEANRKVLDFVFH